MKQDDRRKAATPGQRGPQNKRPPAAQAGRSTAAGREPPRQARPAAPPANLQEYRQAARPNPAQQAARKRKYSPEQRRRRRKRRMVFFYSFLVVLVLTAAAVLSLTVLFKIDAIELTGSSRYAEQEILDAAGIKKGENLFLAKTDAGEKTIETSLPYIGKVKISRVLPAKIVISVEEAGVTGAAEYNGGYAVLSGDKVLEFASTLPQDCPVIRGLVLSAAEPGKKITFGDETVKQVYRDLSASLERIQLSSVTEIDLTDLYKIKVIYDGRITLLLGSAANFDYKLRFAKEGILEPGEGKEKKIGDDETGELDLSLAPDNERAYFNPTSPSSSSAPDSSASPAEGGENTSSSGENSEPSSSAA